MVKKTPGAILPSDRKHREFHLSFSSERDQNPACSSLFTDWSESRFFSPLYTHSISSSYVLPFSQQPSLRYFAHIERNVIYNIMYGRITFTDTGQFLSVQIHFRRTDI